MDHFAGLDVSVKETSVCIVQWFDQNGQVGKVLDQLLGWLLSKVGTWQASAISGGLANHTARGAFFHQPSPHLLTQINAPGGRA